METESATRQGSNTSTQGCVEQGAEGRSCASFLAERLVTAISGGAAGIGEVLAAGVHFRALLPGGLREASGPEEVEALFARWFGGVERRTCLAWSAEEFADRLHARWRFEVKRSGDGFPRVIEQSAFLTVAGGRIAAMDLVCSGFRPVAPIA